jgi:hypothetical protein
MSKVGRDVLINRRPEVEQDDQRDNRRWRDVRVEVRSAEAGLVMLVIAAGPKGQGPLLSDEILQIMDQCSPEAQPPMFFGDTSG